MRLLFSFVIFRSLLSSKVGVAFLFLCCAGWVVLELFVNEHPLTSSAFTAGIASLLLVRRFINLR